MEQSQDCHWAIFHPVYTANNLGFFVTLPVADIEQACSMPLKQLTRRIPSEVFDRYVSGVPFTPILTRCDCKPSKWVECLVVAVFTMSGRCLFRLSYKLPNRSSTKRDFQMWPLNEGSTGSKVLSKPYSW